ncbi:MULTISPECIES: hypothetical protein [Bacillus]|uniref:hypothetical protein n=1 Tax=Bacillus TaxID=1386 RepID=UPI001BAAD9F5|nr:hypothetical protein [Bacillus subtilis]MBR0021626.1 hypothetical protein [Bacillus subtilis]MBZ6491810.1 hypothetical protein [Bacillus subtilis subsp. subtilis]MEC1431880.1 hypothetical protein [Bacillus subtilis]
MIEIEISEPVFIFYQGIETPESALDEHLEKIPKEEQEIDIAALKVFINSDYSDEEKNDFIDEVADGVDILSYGVSPIIWLEQVIHKIEKKIETL